MAATDASTIEPSIPSGSDAPGSIFVRFLKFGCLAWGGPAAQIAMIKRECVDEEGWIDEASFKKLLAVYQILPGPEAHELCVYFGRLRGGKLGGFLAGLGFMLPASSSCWASRSSMSRPVWRAISAISSMG
jgi:chromate transporter